MRGDLQLYNGEEINAATVAYRTFRIFVPIVTTFGLDCNQMAAINAFIHTPMNDEVYVQ